MWEKPVTDRDSTARYNASDLNRVDANCAYLAQIFNVSISTRTWTRNDWPTPSEFARILSNINALKAAYPVAAQLPETPENPINRYDKANDIERILQGLKSAYDEAKMALNYTGEIYSGDTIGVI